MANVINGGVGRYGATVFASAARTVTQDTQEFEVGPGARSVVLVADTTAAGTSPSTVFKLEAIDRVSGKVYQTLSTAAVTGTGTVTLTISPWTTTVANTSLIGVVQPVYRVTATHGNATSHTYTVALIIG